MRHIPHQNTDEIAEKIRNQIIKPKTLVKEKDKQKPNGRVENANAAKDNKTPHGGGKIDIEIYVHSLMNYRMICHQ